MLANVEEASENEGWAHKVSKGSKKTQGQIKKEKKQAKINSPPGLKNRYLAIAPEEIDEDDEWSEAKLHEWNSKVEREDKVKLSSKKNNHSIDDEMQHEVNEDTMMMCLLDVPRGKETNTPNGKGTSNINAVEERGKIVDMVVDSGCSIPVIPRNMVPGYAIVPSEASKAGVRYTVANGDTIPNEGETTVALETEEGTIRGLKFQVAETTRPLISVGAIMRRGHKVTLDDTGGQIYHIATGQTTRIRRINGVDVLRTRIVPPKFARQMGF